MSIFNFLRKQPSSANVAKERLQIIVSQRRGKKNVPDFLPVLQKEIMAVINKYIKVDEDAINIKFDRGSAASTLELNVALPED